MPNDRVWIAVVRDETEIQSLMSHCRSGHATIQLVDSHQTMHTVPRNSARAWGNFQLPLGNVMAAWLKNE